MNQAKSRILIAAIHRKCMECRGGRRKGVRLCGERGCPLWPHRLDDRTRKREIRGQMRFDDYENSMNTSTKKENADGRLQT